jgi:hypothetical protein
MESEFLTDLRGFVEIHARRPLRRDQLDERTAMFGNDNALTARRGCGSFRESGFGLADGKFHGAAFLTGWSSIVTHGRAVVTR